MSRLTTLTSRQEKLKLNPPFIVTMNNTTSNIDISSNLTTNLSISSNLIINNIENGKSIIYFGTQNIQTSALKTAIIAEGMNDWSRAKLHFCLNNRGAGVLPDGNNTIYNASIADARMTILYDGNVGIGKTNPAYKLHVTAGKTVASTAFAMKISGGEFLNIGNHGTLIGLGSEDGSFTKCAIGHVRNDSDDRGDIVFLATNNTGSGSCSMSDEKMRISKFGFVGIGNTNPVSLLSLNATPRSADTFNWGNCPMTITHPTITGATASTLNDPKPILHLCRDGTVSTNYAERATFNLCRYEHPISNPTTGSRTRLDIGLTHTTFDDEICVMSLRSDGNVGIGKTNPNCRLYISANLAASATVYAMRLSCGTSTDAGGFGTLLGLGSEPNGWSKCAIGHTRTANYDQGDIVFLSRATADNADCTMSDEKMRIKSNGNVGIGTNNPGNILQVGDGARLRISNGPTDYTLIGTNDVDDANNTRIVISGNTRSSPHAGNIDYVSTAGFHIFYTNGSTERMRIANDGTITTSNIDCIGGIAITAANAFYQTTSVDPGNLSQTYITFKEAGANSDWCYLRQIGGTNEYKLALDIHDDGTEARFCIRSIASVNATDTITEVFAVDNGNVKATGTVRATGFTAVNGEYELMIAPPTATAAATIQTIQQNTGFNQNLTLQAVTNSGNIGIGITNPVCKLEIKGAVGINNGSSYAIANNKMQAGSLTIGDQTLNYGGGIDWTANTAGLMFECLDNTEIAVHDSGNRVSSLMYFQGGATNSITIGRNFSPWGAISSVVLNGNVGIGNAAPFYPLCIGTPSSTSDGVIVISKNSGGGSARNFKMGYDANYNFTLGDFGVANNNTNEWQKQLTISYTDGNVGIGTANQAYKLYVNGNTYINGLLNINAAAVIMGTANIKGTLITNNKVDFTNGSTISVEGAINFGGGGWHVNSFANIYYTTEGAVYSRMVFSCYNATSYSYNHGGFYFTSGNGGTIGVNVPPDNSFSIKTDKACYFVTTTVPSDRRIKTNIIDIDDYSALQQILLIEPKRYEYIDKITRGSNVVIGFIAQQVKEVIPEAINIISDIIPNIYKKATFNNSNINFIDNTDLSFIKINDSIKIQLNGENIHYKIQNINTNNIIVDNIIKNSHENIANSDNNECFVYGTEVHDFHAMNKDYIFTMNVCATQELYKLIQNQNIIIEELKNKIETLESRL